MPQSPGGGVDKGRRVEPGIVITEYDKYMRIVLAETFPEGLEIGRQKIVDEIRRSVLLHRMQEGRGASRSLPRKPPTAGDHNNPGID